MGDFLFEWQVRREIMFHFKKAGRSGSTYWSNERDSRRIALQFLLPAKRVHAPLSASVSSLTLTALSLIFDRLAMDLRWDSKWCKEGIWNFQLKSTQKIHMISYQRTMHALEVFYDAQYDQVLPVQKDSYVRIYIYIYIYIYISDFISGSIGSIVR
jgi:hypothetical protein